MSVVVQTERFEGPLGLLLHLIRKEEMDIFDIDIQHITDQYLKYIRAMKKLDLEMAGDFIAMAATLIQIKSRMLLPQYGIDGEEVDEFDDPRRELASRLFEYQRYKEASQDLYERPLLGRDLWTRGYKEKLDEDRPEEEIVLEDNPLFALITSYRNIINSAEKIPHSVKGALQSISERISEMRGRLPVGRMVGFFKLMNQKVFATRSLMVGPMPEGVLAYAASPGSADADYLAAQRENHVLVTFLSLLELTKIGFTKLFQSEDRGEIQVEALKVITDDALSRVEEYEVGPQASADELAEKLFNDFEASEHSSEGDSEEGSEQSNQAGEDFGTNMLSSDATPQHNGNVKTTGMSQEIKPTEESELAAAFEADPSTSKNVKSKQDTTKVGFGDSAIEDEKSFSEESSDVDDENLEQAISENLSADFMGPDKGLPQWEQAATDEEIQEEEELLFKDELNAEEVAVDLDAQSASGENSGEDSIGNSIEDSEPVSELASSADSTEDEDKADNT